MSIDCDTIKKHIGYMANHIRGQRIIVTGASSGIGFFTALGLACLGARIAAISRRKEKLKILEDEAARNNVMVTAIPADLTVKEEVDMVLEEARRVLGEIDALIYNIGNIRCEPCELHEASYEDWLEAALRYTITPGYLASRLLGFFLRRGRGTMIFLSSVSVREPMRYFVLADTARAGLQVLAKAIARYYGSKGVKAYTILLGSFDTPGARRNIERIAQRTGRDPALVWQEDVIARSPLRRAGRPEELIALIAFLLSPYAEYLSGSTITLDGAMSRCVG